MYLMYKHKNMLPSEYRKIKHCEKRILHTFMKVELDEIRKEQETLYGKGVSL